MKKSILLKRFATAALAAVLTLGSFSFNAPEKVMAAESFEVGTTLTGTLEDVAGATKNYQFTTNSDDACYKLVAKATNNSSNDTCLKVTITDEDGKKVGQMHKYTWGSGSCGGSIDFKKDLKPNKTYYVEVTNWTYTDGYNFEITVSQYTVDDYPDNRTQVTEFAVGQELNAVGNYTEDVDYFKFTTDASDSFYDVTAKMYAPATNASSKGELYLFIYSDAQMTQEVSVNNYIDFESSKDWTLGKLTPNTTYYVKAVTYSLDDYCTAGYGILVSKKTDDVADTSYTATELTLNESAKFCLQKSYDEDFFKVNTANYTKYTLTFANLAKSGYVYINVYSDKECTNKVVEDEFVSAGSSLKSCTLSLKPYSTYYLKVAGRDADDISYKVGLSVKAPKATVKKTSKKVTLTWSKVNKAGGYEIWRATKSGKYKKVKTVKSAKTLKWVDKKVKKGNTYKYMIRAYAKVNGKTYYSAYSAVKSVKVK